MTDIVFMCALCGRPGDTDELIGIALSKDDAFEQWWAHPACVRSAFVAPALVDVHPEIAEALGLPPDVR